jgi:hypothetical protein
MGAAISCRRSTATKYNEAQAPSYADHVDDDALEGEQEQEAGVLEPAAEEERPPAAGAQGNIKEPAEWRRFDCSRVLGGDEASEVVQVGARPGDGASQKDDEYNFDYAPASLGASHKLGGTATGDDLAAALDHAEAIVINEIALIHRSDDRWTYAKLISRCATGMIFLLKETPRLVKHIPPAWYSKTVRRLARQTDDNEMETHSCRAGATSPSLPIVHVESMSIVKCKRYSGLKRGSIVSVGTVTRKRKNGTFDVLYQDGLKEVGVKPSSIVHDTPKIPEYVTKTDKARKQNKNANWTKLKTAVRVMGGLERARARAAAEERVLLNDALFSLQTQIDAQAQEGAGYLKGDAGLIAMLEVQELAISSDSKQLDGDTGLNDVRQRLTDLRDNRPSRARKVS